MSIKKHEINYFKIDIIPLIIKLVIWCWTRSLWFISYDYQVGQFFTNHSKVVLLCGFCLFVSRLSLLCCFFSLKPCGNLWERADLLALLCLMFSCVFVTFPYGVLGLSVVLAIIDS